MEYDNPQRATIDSYRHYMNVQPEDLVAVYRSHAENGYEIPIPLDEAMKARAPTVREEIDSE